MTREQLEHAIRAACDVAEDTELFVFGSQAILGEHPDAPPELRTSIEVDVQPVNRPDQVDAIDGALGELSQFHTAHGFYVHGVSIGSATIPKDGRRGRFRLPTLSGRAVIPDIVSKPTTWRRASSPRIGKRTGILSGSCSSSD